MHRPRVMPQVLRISLILVAAALGCQHEASTRPAPASAPIHILTWTGYSGSTMSDEDPENATYILDGLQLGRGESGLQELIRKLKQLERGSTLEIVYFNPRPPNDGSNYYTTPYTHRFEEISTITRDLELIVISR